MLNRLYKSGILHAYIADKLGDSYNKTSIPNDETKTAPGGRTYTSRLAFANAYSSFDSDPRYIRTVLIDGNVVGHEACLYYNNRESFMAKQVRNVSQN